jgi:hypothetical protein
MHENDGIHGFGMHFVKYSQRIDIVLNYVAVADSFPIDTNLR